MLFALLVIFLTLVRFIIFSADFFNATLFCFVALIGSFALFCDTWAYDKPSMTLLGFKLLDLGLGEFDAPSLVCFGLLFFFSFVIPLQLRTPYSLRGVPQGS